MASRPLRSNLTALLSAAVLASVLAGCGAIRVTPEPATPTDFPGLTSRFTAGSIQVRDWVSGDAGCSSPELIPTAISFTASGLDQAEPVRLYLYIFGDHDAFERNRDSIGACAASYVTDHDQFEEVEQSPYVVAGQGPWAPQFEARLREVLATAAGNGG